MGGTVYYDYQRLDLDTLLADQEAVSPFPKHVVELLGEDFFHDVVFVQLSHHFDGPRIVRNLYQAAEIVPLLDGVPHLKVLALARQQLTNDGMTMIGKLRDLEVLVLNEPAALDDDGMSHLKDLRKLRRLDLFGAPLTDRSLRLISRFPRLKQLDLTGHLGTNDGLSALRGMTQLERLSIGGPQITDDGLVHLRGLTHLEYLMLQGAQVTNEGLIHLAELKDLKVLHLNSTQVTDFTRLQVALPKCRIDR